MKPGLCLTSLAGLIACGMGVGFLSTAHAQSQPTTRLQGQVDVQAYATQSNNPLPGSTAGKELIITATPSLKISSKGANTQIDGQWQWSAINYVRNSQPDRIVPTGALNLRANAGRSGLGLDASVSASQVKSTLLTPQSDTPSTLNSYTDTTYRLSPFFDKDLDGLTHASVRLDRSVLHSTQLDPNLVERPDSRVRNDVIKLDRKPVPLGYGLEVHQQQTQVSGQQDPALDEVLGRATALYAPLPEINVGLSLGRGRNRIGAQNQTETTHGWQAQWRPTERSLLKGEVEDRYFGKSWKAEASHRTPWLAFGLTAERAASTYAQTIGNLNRSGSLSGLYEALLTTRITDPVERRQVASDMVARRNLSSQVSTSGDVYDVAAQLRQATSGKLAFMGRRDIVTFVGGLTRTAPLTLPDASSSNLLTATPRTKEYFFDAQLNHQLTPRSTVSTGLRWTRAVSTSPFATAASNASASVLSRDFSWRAAFNTTLTPETTATMGLKRQLTHNPSTTSSDESAMFVGLGHRF